MSAWSSVAFKRWLAALFTRMYVHNVYLCVRVKPFSDKSQLLCLIVILDIQNAENYEGEAIIANQYTHTSIPKIQLWKTLLSPSSILISYDFLVE